MVFNGFPRQDGNTAQALKVVLGELSKEGIESSCGECEKKEDKRCVLKDDCNPLLEKILAAGGILSGRPHISRGWHPI